VTRRILLLPWFAMACIGFVKGQGTAKIEEDPAGEAAIHEVRDVLTGYDQATKTGNADARAPLFNDQMLCVSERFGRGETLNKAEVMDLYRSGKLKNISYAHDNIRLQAFGGNTVVMTGRSTTILRYKGKLSKGPRLFTFVFVKLNGQWQIAAQHISDIPKGDAPWN
jgi:hypothetical protein